MQQRVVDEAAMHRLLNPFQLAGIQIFGNFHIDVEIVEPERTFDFVGSNVDLAAFLVEVVVASNNRPHSRPHTTLATRASIQEASSPRRNHCYPLAGR